MKSYIEEQLKAMIEGEKKKPEGCYESITCNDCLENIHAFVAELMDIEEMYGRSE